MLDLISLIVTLIIMSLFGLGVLMVLIIMSQEKTDLEIKQNEEDETAFIKEWQEKQKQKKEARRKRFYNFINKIKKFLLGGRREWKI